MQEVEEQALLAKIIAEQQALQEAAAKRPSNTLPPQAPPAAQAGSQGYSGGAGAAGGPNTTGGGGGAPRPQFFNPNMVIVPAASPSTGSVPATVQFSVTGDSGTLLLGAVNITWAFGDGGTGGGQSPSYTYDAGGFYTAQMTASSIQNPSNVTMAQTFVSISAPTLIASFIPQGATVVYTAPYYSASANDTITLHNTSTATDAVTYAWTMPSGTPALSTATSPTVNYATPGAYTVTLTVSDSFGNTAVSPRNIQITPAVLSAVITSPPNANSGPHPLTETFVNGTVIPAISNPVTWKWTFGSGSLGTSALNTPANQTYTNPGTFTIKLEATGSDGQNSATTSSITAT